MADYADSINDDHIHLIIYTAVISVHDTSHRVMMGL